MKTIRSSSLSFINKLRSTLPSSSPLSLLSSLTSSSSSSYYDHNNHCHHSSTLSSTFYIQRFQSINITDYNDSKTRSITHNRLQQSDENVCNDDGLPIQSYRHSTFRPYPIPQEDENSFRPCRSHESLLAYSSATHMIDLDEAQKQIHPSVVDASNCFKMENTYYGCRNSRERNRWVE
ncbi:unnamed protein product, partial [Acanthocheilonema viteae]